VSAEDNGREEWATLIRFGALKILLPISHPRRLSPPVRISAKPILPIIVEEPEPELVGTGEPY